MTKTITLPSFLNFNRSISPSEGLLYSTRGQERIPVEVQERGIRGAISSYANVYKEGDATVSGKNKAKLLDPENANLQRIDGAFLAPDADGLELQFSVVVQAGALEPSGCNDEIVFSNLRELAAAYNRIGGFDYLGRLYAWNLINGRVLWRNRYVAKKAVAISAVVGEKEFKFSFNVDAVSLSKFDETTLPEGFDELAALVGEALSGRNNGLPLFLTIAIRGSAPGGSEVYPSQEFVEEGAKKEKGSKRDKSRVLSARPLVYEGRVINHASLHSQKIGNAIRVIDGWHGKVEEFGYTAVEFYGYVQSRSTAHRLPGKGNAPDVYKLMMDMEGITVTIGKAKNATKLSGDVHYLMAMLVRGGVFSGASKTSKTAKGDAERPKADAEVAVA